MPRNNICPPKAIEQAVEALTRLLARPAASLQLPLLEAHGRLLAEDIHARHDVPRWDNSAMDGYALNSADLPQQGGRLPLAVRQQAIQAACCRPGIACRSSPGRWCRRAPIP